MTTIPIPAFMASYYDLESTPGGAEALARELRSVTANVKDVQSSLQSIASPDWQGDTAAAHDHAATRFARRADTAEAALERAVTAADVFHERLLVLAEEQTRLDERRGSLNYEGEVLETDVKAAPDAQPQVVADLRRRGADLAARVEDFRAAVTAWEKRCKAADEEFIAALAAVDSVAEGRAAAADPGRVDVDALTDRFDQVSGDPAALKQWWAGLSPAERQALITEHPERIGNADGLPVADRDEANRTALGRDLDYLGEREADGQLSDDEKKRLENAVHVRDALEKYRARIDYETGEQITNLIVYKPGAHTGDGGVAISFGDPDTADHVSVNVPGLTSTTGSTDGNLAKTMALHDQALGEANGTVASVYWLDYDAPSGNPIDPRHPGNIVDFGSVVGPGRAADGGERFADFLGGLRTSDEGERAHVTAIGHSYGSTTVGQSLRDGVDVDDVVLIGSPGVWAENARELTDADVWVGAKDRDPVSLLGTNGPFGVGTLGNDPTTAEFGARRFDTGDDGGRYLGDLLDNHTSYFKGESLDNMAAIVTDHDDDVTSAPRRGEPGGEYIPLSGVLAEAATRSGGDWLVDRGEDALDYLTRGPHIPGIG